MEEEIDLNNVLLHPSINVNMTHLQENGPRPIFDALTELIIEIIFFVAICFLFGTLGTVTNIINIVVYIRIGIFRSSSNLNLFSLAVSDLGTSFTTLMHAILYSGVIADIAGPTLDLFAVNYLAFGWPSMIFVVANRILTSFVALERCLCVVLPFQVKAIFTIKRSMFYIIAIYAYAIISHVPIYIIHQLEFREQEGTNVSKRVLVYTADREMVHAIVFYLDSFVVAMGTVVVVFVCTVITSRGIKTSKKWRKSVNATTEGDVKCSGLFSKSCDPEEPGSLDGPKATKRSDETIDRETKLIKMINVVSWIFLVCYIPEVLLIIMKAADDEIRLTGAYYRLAELMYSLGFVSTCVNSSINIFVYYRMSTRFREECSRLFSRAKATSN